MSTTIGRKGEERSYQAFEEAKKCCRAELTARYAHSSPLG